MIFLSLSIGAIVLLIYIVHRKNKAALAYWPKKGVKLSHNGNVFIRLLTQKLNFLEDDAMTYRSLKQHKFGGTLEMWNPVLYVTDLELIKNIYIKNFDHFSNRRGFDVEKNDPHMHFNLFNQQGLEWKKLRNKMTPTFTTGKIRRMFQIFNGTATKLVKAIKKESTSSSSIEVSQFLQAATMDVINSAAFGVQTDTFEDPNSKFFKMGQKIQKQFAGSKMLSVFFVALFPKMAELLGLKLMDDEADKFLISVITNSLSQRQKTGMKREDFLQLMIEAREKQKSIETIDDNDLELTDDLIIAQCLLFILGGFDTTESLLLWACYELALCQDVQETLYNEVSSIEIGKDGDFSYEQINQLEYLEMFVSETLRKYPPVHRTERRSTKPYQIPGTNFVLPKDTLVAMPVYAIHHDPEYWPEPEKFNPERFTKENVTNRHPMSYHPFGQGPRNCIAFRFALAEAKVVIAHLVLNLKFERSDKTIVPPIYANGGNLKPADGMPLKINAR